jgi:hypothetical protein
MSMKPKQVTHPDFYYAKEDELKNDRYRHATLNNVVVLKDGSLRQQVGSWNWPRVLRAFRSF